MTETLWLTETDPEAMLELLWERASDRKLRLFACGCCRLVWHLFADERSWQAVEAAERYADGTIDERELSAAAGRAYAAYTEAKVAEGYPADGDVHPEYAGHLPFVAYSATREADFASGWALSLLRDDQEAACELLRCIFGNPFRPVTLDVARLASPGTEVARIAHSIYADAAFGCLPVLADALEDAGCDRSDLLSHLRSAGLHVRGCHALDLLLGKE